MTERSPPELVGVDYADAGDEIVILKAFALVRRAQFR
jgi:hypothetical protein